MNPADEVRVWTRKGWRSLRPGRPVAVDESELFSINGLAPGATVRIGSEHRAAGGGADVRIDLATSEALHGHLGLIEVVVDGTVVGEVDVVPGKLSEPAYQELRADLQRVWAGLVLDPEGVSRLQAGPPPPSELWRRIEAQVRDVALSPREVLVAGEVPRHRNRVRRARELTPSVTRAAHRGGAGLARVTTRSTDTPEHQMVVDTLVRLRSYAERHPEDGDVATQVGTVLRSLPRVPSGAHRAVRPTWGMRSDPRYRRIHAVRRILERPDLEPTEGPGELRLGVKGMVRLYEYWVFLQVLLACEARYGPPLEPGYAVLGTSLHGGRHRLDLPRGTTVRFADDIHVGFEPEITTRGDRWRRLEYVPHPDPDHFQSLATPDVVVLREGREPEAVVIDAKYVAREGVDRAALATHAKYSRIRLDGRPVVRQVLVAHPHAGKDDHWAGYGGIPMAPGLAQAPIPLP